ncbi:mannitol dehydrogenase [Clostridia bacterium]|nr:mannitol dehydrogenase [Clostridia bacterium]
MKLNLSALTDRSAWETAGIKLPRFDVAAVSEATRGTPHWLHFGAGNIFRAYIARLQQDMLDAGLTEQGIIAAETFDEDIVRSAYYPYDNLSLLVTMKPDGQMDKTVIGSVTQAVWAACAQGLETMKRVASMPSLQIISFTITEKGYTITDPLGKPVPAVSHDIERGPMHARSVMGIVTAMLLARHDAGGTPIALLSLDNCSQNGEKLRLAVTHIAKAWVISGYAPESFLHYLAEMNRVAFPWSMIDKITPRPDPSIQQRLEELGVEGMDILATAKGTYIAPFVNAEAPGYLVIEDAFPNGRPPLEKVGVYMTDRNTVSSTERMKVCTCLNPLHTGMATFGCLLGFKTIAAQMQDADCRALVERIGSVEGMPVVTDPGIIRPEAFLREVIDERLSNPYIPDTPERITTDQSSMMAIRFGETLKAYSLRDDLDTQDLVAIPLAIAGWIRYLMGVDDLGRDMPISPDPYAAAVQAKLDGIVYGQPGSYNGQLTQVLNNVRLFGVDLYSVGLGEKVEALFTKMIEGPGSVRRTLHEAMNT